MTSQIGAAGRVRGEAKRDQLVAAALGEFLAHGYAGTSVNQVAAAARASKRTVYAHFPDKERMFREVIASTIEPMQRALQGQLDLLPADDPGEALRALINRLASLVVTPRVVQLRRLVIAETDRFPDLAAEWYRLGPAQTISRISKYLEALLKAHRLRIDDTDEAAEELLWLSVSPALNRLLFQPSGTQVTPEELARTSSRAFDTFWLAHGPTDSSAH